MIVPLEKPGTPAELVHFGVKGMKWGVRKERKAVKAVKKQAKREARAQKFVKKATEAQKEIDKHKAKGQQSFVRRVLPFDRNTKIADLEKVKTQALKDAEAKRQGKLSRGQKRVVIGGAIVGVLVAGGVLAVTMNSGQARQAMNRGREIVTGEKFKFKENAHFKGDMSAEGIHTIVQKGINPDYGTTKGAAMNCRRATFAYEMRRRGYDVEATKTPTGSGQHAGGLLNVIDTKNKDIGTFALIRRIAKNDLSDPTTRHAKAITKRNGSLRDFKPEKEGEGFKTSGIFKRLSEEPDRSRGEVTVMYPSGGGHSMSYEVISGVAHIFDNQTGKHYPNVEAFDKDMEGAVSAGGFTRLDNMVLDQRFLERWVK